MRPNEIPRPRFNCTSSPDHREVRRFYDSVFYKEASVRRRIPLHLRRLAARLGPWKGRHLLDVGCGTGQWLVAASEQGATAAGIDISQVAIDACRQILPEAELHCGPAESLPFEDGRFDVVTCLGSLEHFLEPGTALREMVRVAKTTAVILLLVPNAGFFTRRIGLFHGTRQSDLREQVLTLADWEELFDGAGLRVTRRWRDLHILSWSWIGSRKWYLWPVRAAQALALPFWPIAWQYQVYHLCQVK